MLVNLYRSRTAVAIASLPLLIALISSSVFFKETHEYQAFYQWQTELLHKLYSHDWLHFLLLLVLVSVTAHQFNRLFNEHSFFAKGTLIPGLIYPLCLISFEQMQLTTDLISHLFIVFALMQVFKLRRQEDAKAIIFKSGLLIGIAIVFSPMLLPLILIPWIGLIIFKPFIWREWILLIVGFAIPVFYQLGINYVVSDVIWVPLSLSDFKLEFATIDMDIYQLSSRIYLLLIILYSIWKVMIVNSGEVVRFKKQSRLLFHLCWVLAIPAAFEWLLFSQYGYALAIPLSIIIAIALLHGKNSTVVNSLVVMWFIINETLLFI